tara:strand:+ start:2464 stop:6273 length:3810 start_codon:yes stop_codon:yes gene_type:complete
MSSNQMTSERSMNGIISIYSEDIAVNKIDANEIIVDALTINNSLEVNNITLSPQTISFLDGTTSNIQTQINNISGDLGSNYVDLSNNQTIIGEKTFTNTTTLTGNLNVASTDITPTELSFLDGVTSNIQTQIDSAIVGVTLDTNQVITGFKDFTNGLQAPFINNQETTGTINGYFTDDNDFIYTSKTGVFNVGTSKISGVDCVNEVLTELTTTPNTGSISPSTIVRKAEIFTYQYYINQFYNPDTDTIIVNDITGLLASQGIQFSTISDFISSIGNVDSPYNVILLNSTLTNSPLSTLSSFILNGQLITDDTVTLNYFLEGSGLTKPTQITSLVVNETYVYTLTSPNTITDNTPFSVTTGFNYNNSNWTFLDYQPPYTQNNYYVIGTNITKGTRLINLTADKYDYNLTVIDDTPFYTDQGFYNGTSLRIFTGTNTISVDDGVFDFTNNQYAYVTIVNNDNVYRVGKTNFVTQTPTTVKAYINSNLQLVSIIDYIGKFFDEFSITSIDSADIVSNVYNISSPNTITADNAITKLYSYKYDASTLILTTASGIVGAFYFEFPNLQAGSNQLGSYSATNLLVNSVINSNYVTSPITGSSGVIFQVGNEKVLCFGNTTVISSDTFAVNSTLVPYTAVGFLQVLGSGNNLTANARRIVAYNGTIIESAPVISNKDFIFQTISSVSYMIIGSTSVANVNDIVRKSNSNVGINGRYISQKTQSSSTSIAGLYYYKLDGYSQANNNPYLGSLSWTQAKNSTEIVVPYNFFLPNAFQVGDFIRYDGDAIYGFITDLTGSSPANGWRIQAGTFAYGNLSGSDLDIIRTNAGQISTYTPQAFDFYDATRIDTYDDTKNIFNKINYGFFNKTTNDTYSGSARLEFQNNTVNIYSNNVYNAQTSTQIDLPAVALTDTFVVEDFAQNLSNKTFTDDTTFQANIGCVDLTATGDIGCVDLTASANITGSGILDMTNNAVINKIGDISIGVFGSLGINNPALAHSNFEGTTGFNVLLQNTGTLILNAPAGQDISLRNNNTEYFYVDESVTRLRVQSGSIIETFCDATNLYMDFQPNGVSDYAVRLRAVKRNASVGQGWFDTFAYRGRFWFGGTKMMEWGYINANNSFLMGRATSTWIQFNSNTEIYYQINGANRITAASNGYHYAVLHVNTSDRRLKSNIVDVSNALQTINTIEVKEFDKRCSMCCDDDDCTEELSHEIGFIAQQIEETDMSFCVTSSQLNDTKGLKDSCIFALNVKATQELYEMVMKQQEEIEKLKERLSYLNI